MKTNLTVHWTMKSPPTSARSWHSWANSETFSNWGLSSENNEIFFDPNTRSILEQALKQKLDRFTGWDLGKTLEEDNFNKAASVYKRGVPFKSKEKECKVSSLSGSYPILLSSAHTPPSEAMKELYKEDQAFIVMDKNITTHWDLKPLEADFLFEANEKNKSVDTVEAICQTAKKAGDHKHWLIIGGGITADSAAFAASIMNKSFTLVPTTLLAMADACVGGKTGVNAHPFGKNLIGAFAFPSKVIVVPQFLSSLDTRVLRSGGAECLKHAFLAGNKEKANKISQALKHDKLTDLSEELEFVIELKAKIVAEDPTEQGKRSILNLGHTLAHALEAISHKNQSPEQQIQHGEAVSVGLIFCFLISKHIIPESGTSIDEMIACIVNANQLPSRNQLETHLGTSLDKEDLWKQVRSYLLNDKKNSDNDQDACNWVLLKDWGEIYCQNPEEFSVRLTLSEVKKVWDKFIVKYPL